MMMKMEEGQRSNDATKMRATLKASQNGLAELKQDMAACKNMMSMMDKMESGTSGPMGEMGGMREGMDARGQHAWRYGRHDEGYGRHAWGNGWHDGAEGPIDKRLRRSPRWMPMSETILITGGSGLIGYPLSQRLAEQLV